MPDRHWSNMYISKKLHVVIRSSAVELFVKYRVVVAMLAPFRVGQTAHNQVSDAESRRREL